LQLDLTGNVRFLEPLAWRANRKNWPQTDLLRRISKRTCRLCLAARFENQEGDCRFSADRENQ
jgi:hypothetical protein